MPRFKTWGRTPARSWRPGGDDTPVISPTTVVLTLELDVTENPIAGRLIDRDGQEQPFTGWLGLTHVLSTALADGRAARHSPPHTGRQT